MVVLHLWLLWFLSFLQCMWLALWFFIISFTWYHVYIFGFCSFVLEFYLTGPLYLSFI